MTKISNDAIIKESLDVKIDYSIQFSFRVGAGNNVPDPLFINTQAQHLKTNIREEDEELMFQDLVRGKDYYTRYH